MEFAIHAGPHERRDCPVLVRLPHAGADLPRSVRVIAESGSELPAQIALPAFAREYREAGFAHIALIVPELAAGETFRLRAEFSDGATPPSVAVRDDGAGRVDVLIADELLTTYRYAGNPARPCFFPLIGPRRKRVTRSWPVADDIPDETRDHIHHRSLWVAHGDVNHTDSWSEAEGHGFQIHRAILAAEGGAAYGQVAALSDWADASRRKIMEERRALTAFAVSEGARIFDFDVRFTATECDVRFGDTKEGGILAMRVAPSMDGDHGGRIENSYGAVGEGECWGRRAQWCDYVGEIEGERLGIAVFDHPRSFRHPTYWHVRDYGMYTANPFGWHDFHSDPAVDGGHVLPRGASLDFHYRVYLHRGGTAEAGVAARYHDFAHPPRVEVAS